MAARIRARTNGSIALTIGRGEQVESHSLIYDRHQIARSARQATISRRREILRVPSCGLARARTEDLLNVNEAL
jgi:hypothetical protein